MPMHEVAKTNSQTDRDRQTVEGQRERVRQRDSQALMS